MAHPRRALALVSAAMALHPGTSARLPLSPHIPSNRPLPTPLPSGATPEMSKTRILGDGASEVVLSIVGPGESRSNPTLGTYVTLNVTTACSVGGASKVRGATPAAFADCPDVPWVRVDRVDGVADTTPFVRIADEAASFENAPVFPFWFKPQWGLTNMGFGGSVDNQPIAVVASGWTAPEDQGGTRLTANSSVATIYYDVTYESANFTLSVEDLGPGTVRLTVVPATPGMPMPDQSRFDRFVLSPSDGPTPEFTTSYFYHEESASLSIVVALQQPGIVYYGATPSFRGREGGCTAGGVYDGKPSLHPLALVLAGPDGAVNDTIPAGFAGTVHKMVPLRTPHQFCILNPKITLFAGGKLYLPLCRPDPKNEIPRQPGFVSVIAPSWLSIYPLGNATADPAYQDYPATINATTAVGGGLVRTTFAAGNARNPRWSTYNNFVPLYFDFAPEHARGGQTVTLSVLIHAEMEDGGRVAAPLWQSLQCTLAPTPTVTPLPTRLVTSFTWASQNLLLGGERGNFLQTYRQLGFNTVPLVGSSGKAGTAPSMFPGNRTGADWDGLFFGPEMSGFVPSTGSDFVGHHRPNASLLPPTVPPSGVDSELQQWARAYAYTNATTGLDIAYRGAFFRQAADTFCNLTAASRPDWVFFDDERWQWDGWLETVGRSANAAAQSAPGESPEMLARRMVTEALGVYTGCLPARSPKTTVGWYGDPFPDELLAASGVSEQPSEYGPQHYLHTFPGRVRNSKLRQGVMAGSKPRHLLPWLTACTYGQMEAPLLLASTLHMFGAGATGFSFFIDSCMDDGAKFLALATAIQYVASFEDHFLDGAPLVPAAVPATGLTNVRAWSGVVLGGSTWLVVTTSDPGTAASITLVVVANATGYSACDLTTGATSTIGSGPLLRVELTPSQVNPVATVLHIATDAADLCHSHQLPPNTWIPPMPQNQGQISAAVSTFDDELPGRIVL